MVHGAVAFADEVHTAVQTIRILFGFLFQPGQPVFDLRLVIQIQYPGTLIGATDEQRDQQRRQPPFVPEVDRHDASPMLMDC